MDAAAVFLPSLPRNVEASFRDLASETPNTRRGAVADVVRHAQGDAERRARAVPALEKLLRDDDTAEVRAAAAVGLSDLGATEALPSLLLSVEDAHPMVRQMAINALGELGDPRGEARLRRALGDPRPEVRYQAVIAYTRVAKEPSDVERGLSTALRDDDEAIIHIALRIAEERLEKGERLSAPLEERAAQLVSAEHPDVAAAAAILLGAAGDRRGEAVLVAITEGRGVNGRMPSKEEEQAAVELTGLLGCEGARDALMRRAFGLGRHFKDTCAFPAKVALAAMGEPRAQQEIVLALSARDVAAREGAIVACGRAKVEPAREALVALAGSTTEPRLATLARDALAKLGEAASP